MTRDERNEARERGCELALQAHEASDAATVTVGSSRDWRVVAVAAQRARDAWEALQLWAWSAADEERRDGR